MFKRDPQTEPAGRRRPSRPSTAASPPPHSADKSDAASHGVRLTWARRVAVSAWALAVTYRTVTDGVAFNRELLLLYIATGLIAASIGRGHKAITVLRDWLPFALVLVLYDLSRGAADMLGAPALWRFQPDADRRLFFGTVPTVWLQERIKMPQPPWWEVIISSIYMSFFILPYAVAGVLWLYNRTDWAAFVRRFVALSFAAVAVYVVVPAAPPWAAARCTAADIASGPSNPPCMYRGAAGVPDGGLLGAVHMSQPGAHQFVERISTRGWGTLHLQSAGALVNSGQASVNLVAAIPSLHAALTAMISIFLWRRVKRGWRPLLVAYPLAMAFVLVYSAEHFVVDILLGWALAAAVSALLGLLDSWWSRHRASKSAALAEPTTDLGRRLAVEDPIDLLGDVTDVRRGDHVVQRSQRVPGRQRLDVEDVEPCAAKSLRL
ncbi:phosphatase PAP2 family protein [Mycobacterium sp.]|uniref:phosphatase PAP2 family protein n=1 Tax=Mycobacterium sp. TaxID=1785 RepID=UPI003BAEE184